MFRETTERFADLEEREIDEVVGILVEDVAIDLGEENPIKAHAAPRWLNMTQSLCGSQG